MNRTEFMNQLGALLQNISPGEREEALQYYNDYFDDAGAENEQKVLEALGNPARVAENIRRELLENQAAKDATAADRALVEYGKATSEDGQRTANSGNAADRSRSDGANQGNATDWSRSDSINPGNTADWGRSGGAGAESGNRSRSAGMSGGMIALIIVLAVFASPFIVGLLCVVFGLLVTWFALIFSFGAVALSLFIVLIILLVVGVMCVPTDPLVGAGVIGSGLICGALGLLFLMLTVALAGIATPAIFRGIGCLFRAGKKRRSI